MINEVVNQLKIIMLGDSITQGWDGSKTVAKPLSALIQDATNVPVTNLAQGGSEVSGNRNNDAATILAKNKFTDYDCAIIMYGTNDLNLSTNSLYQVIKALQALITRLRTDNSAMIIIGVVPMQSFLVGNSMDDLGKGGYSQNQLCDAELKIYQSNNCYTLDWRDNPIVTPGNRATTLGDKELHPTQETYELMAQRVEKVLLSIIKIKPGVQLVKWLGGVSEFMSNLTTNFDQINTTINQTVELINQQELTIDRVSIVDIPQIKSDYLNRATYLAVQKSFVAVTVNINQVLQLFNRLMYYDNTDAPASLISVTMPTVLALNTDDYNACWAVFQQALDSINEIITVNELIVK